MNFYDKLIYLINEKHMTQRQFLTEIGLNSSAIQNWRRQNSKPRPETMLKIAEYFGVSYDSLSDDSMEIEAKKAEKNKYFSDENSGEKIPAKCPFCGERTVSAAIITTLTFVSKHALFEDGAAVDGESIEPESKIRRIGSYCCLSCGKRFFPWQFKFVKNAPDGESFVKIAEKPRSEKKGKES